MSTNALESKRKNLHSSLSALIGVQIDILRFPRSILANIEPSQVGTIVGGLMDVCIPELRELLPDHKNLSEVGLSRAPGILGDREGYPDYLHTSGARVELKLLYVDPIDVEMKKPPTRREPSARITQKVTLRNVEKDRDFLLVVAYQLRPVEGFEDIFSPTIIDVGIFPIIECVKARDHSLRERGGRWFGNYETPVVISRLGKKKLEGGKHLDDSSYGRKEQEGKDFNEDTNFGKLKRIPYKPLQKFLKQHGAVYVDKGTYPQPWKMEGS
mgnify:CR=1 FL=1